MAHELYTGSGIYVDGDFRFRSKLEIAVHFYVEASFQFKHLLETDLIYFVEAGFQTTTVSKIGV